MENTHYFEALLPKTENSVRESFSDAEVYEQKPLDRFIRRACNAAYLGNNYRPEPKDASVFVDSLLQLSIEIADSLPADDQSIKKRNVALGEVAVILDYLKGVPEKSLAILHPEFPKSMESNGVPDIISSHAKVWAEVLAPKEDTETMLANHNLTTMVFVDEHEKLQPKLSSGYTDVHSTILDLLEDKVIDAKLAQHLVLAFGTVEAPHIPKFRKHEIRKQVLNYYNQKSAIVFDAPDDKKDELQLGRKYLGAIARKYPVNDSIDPIHWLAYYLNSDESIKPAVIAHIQSHVSFALAVIMRNE